MKSLFTVFTNLRSDSYARKLRHHGEKCRSKLRRISKAKIIDLKLFLAINMYTFVKYDARLSLWRVFSARYSGDHVWRLNASWSQPLRQANTVWRNSDWLYDVLMSAHVYHCAKNSGGFPNTRWKSDTITRQMHAVLVLFRPLPNVGIHNFSMWGMYDLSKAYRSMQKSIANRRVEDWEASNGHTKDTTQLFHGPWHVSVGEHICA